MTFAHLNRFPDARPTRWRELGYMMLAPRCWRIVDLEQTKYNACRHNTPSCVGPVYLTKAELLADLTRYATDFGATPSEKPLTELEKIERRRFMAART